MKIRPIITVLVVATLTGGAVWARHNAQFQHTARSLFSQTQGAVSGKLAPPKIVEVADPFAQKVVEGAIARTSRTLVYDPAYVGMAYPNGDVPDYSGVCTDVVVRSFRQAGVDLQQEIHEDMKANFGVYPQNWGLSGPDSNIDHRRVPNLMTYFERHDAAQVVSRDPENYQPGDVVAWRLGDGQLHMGVVINEKSPDGRRFLIVHNIAQGTEKADILFAWKIIGHYRYKKLAEWNIKT